MSKLLVLFVAVKFLSMLICSSFETVENGAECDIKQQSSSSDLGPCSCYSQLEKSLFATEKNRFNLKKTFFPPENNVPEFVTVVYSFENSSTTSVWFWSAETSHFLYPNEVFQFLSLLFSKPQEYYTGKLEVTLKEDCANLSNTSGNLQLLTQRVCTMYYTQTWLQFSSRFHPCPCIGTLGPMRT